LAAEKAAAEKQAADIAAQKATQKAEEKATAEKAATEKANQAQKAAEEAKAKRITATAFMKFKREAWVEVTDVRGVTIYSELNPAGSSKEITGTPPLRFTVGNAENVSITFNGKPVDMAPHIGREVARFTLQ
jgi:cytoskeleton protein RodZ